jgi:adenylylsulfate kinase-like enzyme
MMTGSKESRLVVLRGNSGSGKTSIAAELRARFGRGVAVVSQDVIRRGVLQEQDVSGGANIGLIDLVARYSLDQGFHVVVEGILGAARYEPMLTALLRDHRGVSRFSGLRMFRSAPHARGARLTLPRCADARTQ